MTNAVHRHEFNRDVGRVRITCVDYRWCSMGNPEGTIREEAGLRDLDTGEFEICKHGLDHQRAVDMLANCLEHGISPGGAVEHVEAVGRKYERPFPEEQDWRRPLPVVL
jgi:hypothetical protein